MDNELWCQDVPDNMPAAFRMQSDADSKSNHVFCFKATTNSPSSSTPNSSFNMFSSPNSTDNRNNSSIWSNSFTSERETTQTQSPINFLSNQNWKTINNLSTASNGIGPIKRKGFLDSEDNLALFQPPTKQNATEERVFGRFTKLTIDEEFEDVDEFIIALDDSSSTNITKDSNDSEDMIDFETDPIIDENNVTLELCDDIREFWNNDDIITKLYKEQREKESKAMVIWRPQLLYPLSNKSKDEDGTDKESKALIKKTEIVDQTDEYTVYSEADVEIDSISKDHNKLEIIEIDDLEIVDSNSHDIDMIDP